MSGIALALLLPLAACVDAPKAEAQNLTITVRLQNAKLDITKTFVHRGDDTHKCEMPGRIRLPTAAEPRPAPGSPPNHVVGYSVVFGPDPATVEDGGSTVPMGSVPGLPPLPNRVVNYFSLTIDPLPNQMLTAGPVGISRSFSIGMTARGAWRGRFAEQAAGSVVLDADGLGGRFRLANVEPDLAHGRMAESEYVTVTGTWRCPQK